MDPASANSGSPSPDGYESFDDLFAAPEAETSDGEAPLASAVSGGGEPEGESEGVQPGPGPTAKEAPKSRTGRRKRISFI